MIDSLTIFSKGGLIFYQHDPSNGFLGETTMLLNKFISSILLDPTQSQTSKRTILDGNVVVEWEDDKERLAVAIYPEVVLKGRKSVAWIRLLLQTSLKEYSLFDSSDQEDPKLFDATFQVLLRQAESMGRSESSDALADLVDENRNSSIANDQARRAPQKKTDKSKKGKEKTVWHDGNAKVTKEAMAELDYSKDVSGVSGIDAVVADDSRALAEARAAYLPSPEDVPSWEQEEKLDDSSDDAAGSGWGASLKGLMDQMSGNKILTEADLEAPLADMERMLTSKNVASEISKEICDGVRVKLVGKRMNSFHRVKTAVRQALESAIAKILQPAKGREVDLLRSVVTKRDGVGFFGGGKSGDPYVIVMVGINGVGKSTSLAKIAYYLKTNGCSPMLAACDTFRSGAVEQLNVHAKCLDVPLYHKGYAKDPAAVAKAAISHAKDEKHDVVLVDTAGRMQNNVPLMKALSKLVVENKPDLVLFVCEALVGNDGMDQLSMFNKALRSGGHSRQIDGIVLTKFDTVSDKVGAALTMTHVTGAPVVFVGTGQKYNHLKKLSVHSVIKSLFA